MEFPLTFGLQKTGLPLILTSGKTNNLCFLIDTGATHNTLFDFVYNHFKDEFKLLEGTGKTMGIEGPYQEVPIVEATFNFEGTDYTSVFTVLNASEAVKQVQDNTGIQIHGVLGVQFFIDNRWIIDFEKLQIRSNGEV